MNLEAHRVLAGLLARLESHAAIKGAPPTMISVAERAHLVVEMRRMLNTSNEAPIADVAAAPAPDPADVPSWAERYADQVDEMARLDAAFATNIADLAGLKWNVNLDERYIWRRSGGRTMVANAAGVNIYHNEFENRGADYPWANPKPRPGLAEDRSFAP